MLHTPLHLGILRDVYFYQYAFVVKYRLVGTDADVVLSEHVKHVGGKSKRWQRTQEFFPVTKEGMMYRHDVVSLFVKATAAGIVQNDGVSSV